MDWTRAVNLYCERTDAGFWSEPVNALSNAAFLVAALVCWRMFGDRRDPGARLLVLLLAAIGVGSFLFHTVAEAWAGLADVLPILVFVLLYLGLATVRFFGLPVWAGAVAAASFLPFAALVSGLATRLFGGLNGSEGYLPVLVALALYALALRRRAPATAGRLAMGAGLFAISLGFRTLDADLCPVFPLGTHFLWHLLNAVLLGWMIATLVRHEARSGA
ncbi:MAG: ceramidase domain-containing protein [Amaricoccus sp.]